MIPELVNRDECLKVRGINGLAYDGAERRLSGSMSLRHHELDIEAELSYGTMQLRVLNLVGDELACELLDLTETDLAGQLFVIEGMIHDTLRRVRAKGTDDQPRS